MRWVLTFIFGLIVADSSAQVRFKTLVPQQPVAAGEPFQVQYIIEDADMTASIKTPAFKNFRLVSGPNTYIGTVSSGNGIVALKNLVYTLEPVKPGNFIIPGASLVMGGRTYRSNDVKIQVISSNKAVSRSGMANAPDWEYALAPGENAQEKIKQNLFVKVAVDKRSCYAGQPVLATFKLYSRLQSKSDIARNPGFYGFSVYDMINLEDNVVATESLNGKLFDVHTIRKVQLYPLQAGMLTIDAMEILNKVEFSKSAVNKRTEQEITEGLLGKEKKDNLPEGTEVYETAIRTVPVNILVKPVPDKGRPAAYNGATGNFALLAAVPKNNIAKNEEGSFEIIIQGKGNFIQLEAPAIAWPAGIEGFAPVIKDSFDKAAVPLKGSRFFHYPFTCSNPGTYIIPPVSFSFFDTDSNSFKTVSTPALQVTVSNEEIKKEAPDVQHSSIAGQSKKASRTAVIIVVALVLLVLAYLGFVKKEKPAPEFMPEKQVLSASSDLLQPASKSITGEPDIFYNELRSAIRIFLQQRFRLPGSTMNKKDIELAMNDKGVAATAIAQLLNILSQCETGIFTGASMSDDKNALWVQTKEILEQIEMSLK